jgi:transcriptional regulator GlxA family with amidase domain
MESLGRVVDLVQERLDGPVKVADMASAAGCTDGQLERRMKRVFGLTATQYVLRARVDRAAAMLVDTDRPIAEVATECGFSDQANLTRQFGRLIGETPARFRSGRTD